MNPTHQRQISVDMSNPTCSDCLYFRYATSPEGRRMPRHTGTCSWRPQIVWPKAVRLGNGFSGQPRDPYVQRISPYPGMDATDCGTFIEREQKPEPKPEPKRLL